MVQKFLGSGGYNDTVFDIILLRNLSTLPMSAAEQKPDHAGLGVQQLLPRSGTLANLSVHQTAMLLFFSVTY